MKTLPFQRVSRVAPVCAAQVAIRPLFEAIARPPVCISRKQPVP
jgi:hypothetical protein